MGRIDYRVCDHTFQRHVFVYLYTWAADERIKRRRERETQIGERGERTYAKLSLKAYRGRVSRDDPIAQINISTNTRHDSTPLTTTPQAPHTATPTRPVRRRTSIHISYCKSQHTICCNTLQRTGRCPDYPLLQGASAACYARRAVFVLISPLHALHLDTPPETYLLPDTTRTSTVHSTALQLQLQISSLASEAHITSTHHMKHDADSHLSRISTEPALRYRMTRPGC